MARKPAQKKAPAKRKLVKPKAREPETKPRDAADHAIYRDGREARSRSIPRGSSPHIGKARDLWQEGWDFQDGVLS